MEFTDILIVAAVVAVFVVIVFIWAKKTGKRQEERMKMLSEAQLATIKESGLTERGKNLVATTAVLTNVKEGESAKAAVDFIFWNAWTERYELGDDKMSREMLKEVSVGDYITLVIKTKDGIIDKIADIEKYGK